MYFMLRPSIRPSSAPVATGAKQLQIVGMIGPATRAGQDVVSVHDPREMRIAARADALLYAVEAVPVRPVVGKVA